MIKVLKNKSIFAYTIIGLIFIGIISTTIFLIYTQKSSAKQVNIAGKQRMLTQRIALLCNNYYDSPSNESIKPQIITLLNTLNKNHIFIQNIGSKKIEELLYDSRYQYDNLLKQYEKNVLKFISTKEIKHLKIINYTNESLLAIANTLVELLAIEYEQFINMYIIIISFTSLLFIAMLHFVYRRITLKSILTTEHALSELEASKKLLLESQKISQSLSWRMDLDKLCFQFSDNAVDILNLDIGYTLEYGELFDHMLEQDIERLSQLFDDAINYGVPFNAEFGLYIKDEYVFLDIYCEGIISGSNVKELYGILQNVTQKAKLQNEMKTSLEMVDEHIITSQTDVDGKITYASTAFSKISGYKKEELIGKSHSFISHPDMPKDFFDDLWSTITSGKVWNGEIKNKTKDGGFYWVNATISPKFDLNNNIVGYLAIREDITDKKLLQERSLKIEQNERFIKSILDNSAYAIITTTTDGVITLFNKEAEKLLGYKSQELLNKETPALFYKPQEVVKQAAELSKRFNTTIEPGFDVFVEKTKRGLVNNDEWTFISKDKKEIMVKLKVTALKDADGEINGYLGIAEDITELKEKERDIKNYLSLIDKNIITSTTDIQGNITFVSEAFSEISGYSKDELLGQNHRIVKHEDMPDSIYEDLWKTISDDRVWNGEIKNRKKDGGYYWVDASISPVYNISGKKIGYTAIRQDITNKKMVELLSITDGLTNLYNRRYFNDIAQIEIDRAKRDKQIFAFTLLDIDNFKKYNDTYGHQDGDNVLIQVAKSLKESFKRSQDIVFRLGGEEFGAILSATSVQEIEDLVEKARANIEALQIEHIQNLPSKLVTASFGVVITYVDDFTKEFDIDSIYKDADDLLYEAKESGRNRVVTKEKK